MSTAVTSYEEDDLGYEFAARQRTALLSDRVGRTAVRNLTGLQRIWQQARYNHQAVPTQTSGTHSRRHKRYGI